MPAFGDPHHFAILLEKTIDSRIIEFQDEYVSCICGLSLAGQVVGNIVEHSDMLVVQHELQRILALAAYRTIPNSVSLSKEALFDHIAFMCRMDEDKSTLHNPHDALATIADAEITNLITQYPYEYGYYRLGIDSVRYKLLFSLTETMDWELDDVGQFFIVNEYTGSIQRQRLVWRLLDPASPVHEVFLPPQYIDRVIQEALIFLERKIAALPKKSEYDVVPKLS